MSTKSTNTTVEEEGINKEALQITFTNGSLQQLKELAPFLKVTEPADVIKKAIAIIQDIKEMEDKRKII